MNESPSEAAQRDRYYLRTADRSGIPETAEMIEVGPRAAHDQRAEAWNTRNAVRIRGDRAELLAEGRTRGRSR